MITLRTHFQHLNRFGRLQATPIDKRPENGERVALTDGQGGYAEGIVVIPRHPRLPESRVIQVDPDWDTWQEAVE